MPRSSSADPLARLAERQNWIPSAAELAAQDAIRALFRSFGPSGDAIRRALHGTWLHEPLHAVLTDVPVGAWTAAVVFDALSAIAQSRSLDKAADACVILGLAGAAGASISGINDWAEIKQTRPRRIGSVHALLNVAATALFIGSATQRRNSGSRSAARILGALGFVVVYATPHLGGNLIYEHGIGVESKKTDPLFPAAPKRAPEPAPAGAAAARET